MKGMTAAQSSRPRKSRRPWISCKATGSGGFPNSELAPVGVNPTTAEPPSRPSLLRSGGQDEPCILLHERTELVLFQFLFARDFGNLCALKFSLPPKARYGIAIVAGLFLALSFPKPGVAGLAWLAPG